MLDWVVFVALMVMFLAIVLASYNHEFCGENLTDIKIWLMTDPSELTELRTELAECEANACNGTCLREIDADKFSREPKVVLVYPDDFIGPLPENAKRESEVRKS